ncbi:hypothetical protein ASE67_17035 [Sphingomonas sp. Leaf23]|uniref:hypothetical protein n=1 Tax=Sphingomonas sp. Leaf23 TaxID=1735689 RepID=UPI0006F30A07|nr:hypothetical protein [Sphingomonas sp. Leaf23]KQM81651.1 hypothetical protein ASE67_17035 [Sphingomonas sp. Leaf23]
MLSLAPDYHLYAYGSPATAAAIARVLARYPALPPGYLAIMGRATGIVLLWQRRGELRLWGPDEAIGMDDAYGVSAHLPGAVAIGDNGGGELIVHGTGMAGLGLYLVATGSLFLDDDAPWIAPDLITLLERGEGADIVCRSDPIDPDRLGPALFDATAKG